jgi:hypothetical protein
MGERENRDYAIIAVAVCDDFLSLSLQPSLSSFRWSEVTRNLDGCLFYRFDR